MRTNLRALSRVALCMLLAATGASSASEAVSEPGPMVVPAVRRWQNEAGSLALPDKLPIQLNAKDRASINAVAVQLQDDWSAMGFGSAFIGDSSQPAPGTLSLAIAPVEGVPPDHANEAYRLAIADDVRLTAATPTGLFYGTRTLLQMLKQYPDRHLPRGVITDYPDYSGRMLMIDVARKPFPIWVLKDFIRLMSWYKMNELHLHLSDQAWGDYAAFRVQSKRFPGLTAKDLFYTAQDLRDLQDFAKARGVTITPEIDMPGHALCLTNYWPELRHPRGLIDKSNLDVTNPKTAPMMCALLDEMIPLFDAPDFHIGTDEFGMKGTKEERQQIGEAFRRFINTMNAFVRSKGKNCRIWSGFESMPGTTVPDPSVVIDMWVTRDAKSLIDQGHRVINSSDGSTYLVPGAHYYGVNNASTYQDWEPWRISGDPARNPAKDDPHLLGGKLHIWNDQGPSGYTLTEIADLALPSIQAFSEKLWGHKGSTTYRDFQQRASLTAMVPGVTILQRNPARDAEGVVFKLKGEQSLSNVNASVPLPWTNNPAPNSEYAQPTATPSRADLEYPWTLSMKVRRDAELNTRGVIISSDLVEICANYTKETKAKEKGPDGKERDVNVSKVGLGIVRAAGNLAEDPYHSPLHFDQDGVVADPLPLNTWIDLTIVGLQNQTQFFVNGRLVGKFGKQMVCPLKQLGGKSGSSFIGTLKDLTVWNRALSPKQVARAAGLSVPDDLAAGCVVTASHSDLEHGFAPELMVDENDVTRWSSGPSLSEAWVMVDLKEPREINSVRLNFENAFAQKVAVTVSDDAASWKPVASGNGSAGIVDVPFDRVRARYVRVLLQQPATPWGFSLWAFEIFGSAAAPVTGDAQPTSAPAISSIGGKEPPRAARSVHLRFPATPATVFYNELTVEESQVGSYFMACGFQHGYFGIQEKDAARKLVIFSVWDPGPQNNPHAVAAAVPTTQQCELRYQAPDVNIRRFGGEGSGGQCTWDFPWKKGQTYRFAIRSSTAAPAGSQAKTDYAAWFYIPEIKSWKHLATFRTFDGKAGGNITGLYSFVEDFRRDGKSPLEVRRARYGNGWALGQDGNWLPLVSARFSASDAKWEARDNVDAGNSGDCFYLQTGGGTTSHAPLGSELHVQSAKEPPVVPNE